MKHLIPTLLLSAAALGLPMAAHAADLIINEPADVGVVNVAGNWDGVFIGGFVGPGRGSGHPTDIPTEVYAPTSKMELLVVDALPSDYDLSGWLVGVNLGANFTVADGIVAGVVGDIAWSGIGDEDEAVDINWTGSLRGRLGFDAGSFLPYLTGGLAVANVDFDDDEQTRFGWTAGAGVEVALSENLSLDALYRYSDYGSADGLELNTHQVTLGLNWRF